MQFTVYRISFTVFTFICACIHALGKRNYAGWRNCICIHIQLQIKWQQTFGMASIDRLVLQYQNELRSFACHQDYNTHQFLKVLEDVHWYWQVGITFSPISHFFLINRRLWMKPVHHTSKQSWQVTTPPSFLASTWSHQWPYAGLFPGLSNKDTWSIDTHLDEVAKLTLLRSGIKLMLIKASINLFSVSLKCWKKWNEVINYV